MKMRKEDAVQLLANAPKSETKKSKINPVMTEKQTFEFVHDLIAELKPEQVVPYWIAKRVCQVSKNSRSPRMWRKYRRYYF